ncbi:OmpA family protein [Litorivicinus lipolyticus]|uniref:OmpA family protein n=1 Tax=Litorivicinus lipolyticus TaxID=418701 RepID=A0A5Q2QD78_9GAMM|nr:OmpA family protein [Litorivicinus lipolyticus]QGG79800.1 OmpA family protein [Litorivicinus lipolyticus]
MKRLLLAGLIGLSAAANAQVIYSNPPYLSEWTVQSSPVQCVLSQPIDGYGAAIFTQDAGRRARFQLDAFRPVHRSGEAAMVARPGSWRPGESGNYLQQITTRQQRPAIDTQGEVVQSAVNTLLEGWQLVVVDGDLEVRLQPARFPPAYRDWVDCLGALLPVNFADVERNLLYFEKGQNRLTAEHRALLREVADYMRQDKAVTGVFIDGHTDDEGGYLENEDASRLRAEQVGRFMESEGIDPQKVVIRFHGEYYPVATNITVAGRAANRRVSVRMERNGIAPNQRADVVAYDRRVDNAPPRLPPTVDD